MLVDDFLYNVRLVLNDPDDATNNPDQKWPDAEILEHGTRQAQAMSRIQIQTGRGFHNLTIVLQSAAARQLYQDAWQWTLPLWVASLANVYVLPQGTTSGELTGLPYVWTTGLPLQAMEKADRVFRGNGRGWGWDGVRTLRWWGDSIAPKLALEVAKLPPPLFKCTLDLAPSAQSKLYLPVSLSLGREPIEEGAYINAEVQVTSTPTIANFGAVRRCVYSTAAKDVGGARRRELTFEENWPVALLSGDVVQSAIPFGDEHTRALVLLTANACLQKEGAIPIMKAIAPELSDQLQAFKQFASRKDHDGPDFINDANAISSSSSPDQAPNRWRE